MVVSDEHKGKTNKPPFKTCFGTTSMLGRSPLAIRNAAAATIVCSKVFSRHEAHPQRSRADEQEARLQRAVRYTPRDPLEPLPLLESQICGRFYKPIVTERREDPRLYFPHRVTDVTAFARYRR